MATQQSVVLKNETGLHARPAGVLAKAASQFASQVEITAKDRKVNAKSIVSILSLGLEKGDEIIIRAEGADESSALQSLVALVDRQFENS